MHYHEVGQSIAFRYITAIRSLSAWHTTMPGFNTEQQRLIQHCLPYQRKALKLQDLPELSLIFSTTNKRYYGAIPAILLNRQRNQALAPRDSNVIGTNRINGN
ncbi:hypothetical protein O9929_03215 [Vibrio lentus]|nr:hypothetical protein [Vibrio lentus]